MRRHAASPAFTHADTSPTATRRSLFPRLPLLLLGRYSVPFLDYIENATITTVPTDLARTLVAKVPNF